MNWTPTRITLHPSVSLASVKKSYVYSQSVIFKGSDNINEVQIPQNYAEAEAYGTCFLLTMPISAAGQLKEST